MPMDMIELKALGIIDKLHDPGVHGVLVFWVEELQDGPAPGSVTAADEPRWKSLLDAVAHAGEKAVFASLRLDPIERSQPKQ